MEREKKKKIITKHGKHPKDTGSPQVQVAILTQRIEEISDHLQKHPKDNHSRNGLIGLVGERRRHLDYLKKHNKEGYEELIKSLKLRK